MLDVYARACAYDFRHYTSYLFLSWLLIRQIGSRQIGTSFCLVTVIYIYVKHAKLRPGHYFFAGPASFRCVRFITRQHDEITAATAGLAAERVALHFLRVGGGTCLSRCCRRPGAFDDPRWSLG